MNIELNDQTLTAYALGELDDAETRAVEHALAEAERAEDDAPRKSLEEIRAAIALSQEAFATNTAHETLSAEQRANVTSLADASQSRGRNRFPWRAAGLAAAALLVITVYGAVNMYEDSLTHLAADLSADSAVTNMTMQAGGSNVTPEEHDPLLAALTKERADSIRRSQAEAESLRAIGYIENDDAVQANTAQDLRSFPGIQENLIFSTNGVEPNGLPESSADGVSSQGTRLGIASEEIEQLRSLGYLTDDSSTSQPRRIDFSWNAAPGFRTGAVFDERLQRYVPAPQVSPGAEAYKPILERGFTRVADEPLSTFSIDVDTASYANVRRFLQQGQLPPPDAVRVEEMINYFDYAYGQPEGNVPFAAHFEMAMCPWEPQHTLVRIGLKGREIPRAERPPTNLVFLIDVSGSMQPQNKLPLVKWAMSQLASQLDERDRVAIVTYASGVNLALSSTNVSNQPIILNAIASLGAGGSTNGAGGIQMAYQVARQNYLPGGVNRVILATDGDFNVGVTDNGALEQMIQSEARTGVFLSVYGYGMGNLKDDRLEMLADKGNGAYGYIDSESEARREFVEKLSGTLVTIAKDVKVQVEFNPARVGAYRLIGYENRALAAQDFNDDRKDAGEIGAGHTVTALYEVVPAGQPVPAPGGGVDPLRYQPAQPSVQVEAARIAPESHPARAAELLTVKLRYKEPEGHESKLLEFPLTDAPLSPEQTSPDFKFASAVAAFGKLLCGNPLGANLTYDGMMQLAQAGLQGSSDAHRAEMVSLMLQARPMLEAREMTIDTTDIAIDGGIQLLRIHETSPGTYNAQIRTSFRTGWYAPGQAFESYSLLNIDPVAGCVDIYMESLQRTVRLCYPQAN